FSMSDPRVKELRSLVSDHLSPYYDTYFNLLRWIQGNPDLPIEKVADRLRLNLHYRNSSWDVDSVHLKKRGYHPLHKYWPGTRCGRSGVIPNCIVHMEQAGYVDFEGIFDNFPVTEIIKACCHTVEEMLADVMKMEEESGEQAHIMFVIDAEGLEYSKKLFDLAMKSMKALSDSLSDHYTELISSIVVVNAPAWANVLWSMVKSLLPERTRAKINMLSSSNWRDDIKSLMDPSIGPTFWNDENHKDFKLTMVRPRKIPTVERKEHPEKLDQLIVKAGNEHSMEFNLNEGDALRFHFTGNGNFGFTIVMKENEEDDDVLSMRQAYPFFPFVPGPLSVPIEDSVVAKEDGLYKVWFSNSKAWWSSLTIQHSFKVIKHIEKTKF
ncbi:hypothetical protein PRIPAC_77029, partial [Pristionchus pacificus]